ncbi:polymer-forming cytoskeletal protein [Halalkalicoccus subterraneus]|uniref:polymer-forming cytoskeletal protein n=1 Tax=Halalkalicoccus subterraneus TaxID=2675002 RepID=UPI000EFC932C
MSLRPDPLSALSIPDGTVVEEHDLVVDGDVLVGAQSTVEFGIRGRNVVAGERVHFGGHIEAEGDCRLDTWCTVADNVLVGADAYLGERIEIDGQLVVGGDLDIGDDVQIAEGFEASGWIVIRNPMPTIVFLFMYLTHLLRMGEDDAAEELVEELFDEEEGPKPLTIPTGATVSDDAWRVSPPAEIGRDCRLHGNVRAESISVGEDTEIFGSLRARGDIDVASGVIVHGDVTTRNGTVTVAEDARVWGDVSCEHLRLARDGIVDGTIRARGEVNMGLSTDPDGSAQ